MTTANGGNSRLRFYYPLPEYGVKLSRQWPKFRENFQALAPFVRAAYVDLNQDSEHDPGENDLSGLTFGEQDFFNRHRIWYDKQNNRWAFQYNSGTESAPVWDDYLTIRDVDGRVTVHGYGGLDSPVGGFYTPVPRNLAVSSTFTPAALEWVFQHDLDTKPVLWQAFDMDDKSVTPRTVDVSNPNIAYFYFTTAQAGRAMVVAEAARGEGIRVSDGTNIFTGATRLGFNPTNFYLSNEGHGDPVVNLQPIDLSDSSHSVLQNLDADDHPQYARTDGTRAITGRQVFNADIFVQDKVQAGGSFYSNAFGEVAYANQGYLTVTQTNGSPSFTTVNKLTFEQESFYLTTDSEGKPVVNFRGASGSGSSSQFGTGVKTQTFSSAVEWTFNHGLGGSVVWAAYDDQGEAIIPNRVDASNSSILYFYFSPATAGTAVALGGPVVNSISVKETDGTPSTFTATALTFNSSDFYIEADSSGQPIVNLRGSSGGSSGGGGLNNVVEDTTPQLGGNLDVNDFSIVGTPDITIAAQNGASGAVTITGGSAVSGSGGDVIILAGASASGKGGDIYLGPGTGTTRSTVYLGQGGAPVQIVLVNPTRALADVLVEDKVVAEAFYLISGGELASQSYVDTAVAGVSGGGGGGFYAKMSDGTAFGDTVIFSTNDFTKTGQVLTVKDSGIDHSSLANLTSGDPHTQYLLRTEQSPGFYGIVVSDQSTTLRNDTLNFLGTDFDLTSSGGKPLVSLDATVARKTDIGPGFYGVTVKPSGSGVAYKKDTIVFNANDFYIKATSNGFPEINLRGTASGGTSLTVREEDGSPSVSSVSTIRFTNGTVTDNGGGDVSVAITAGGLTVNDGNSTYSSATTVGFSNQDFYLSRGTGGRPVVNLRDSRTIITGSIPSVLADNYFIVPWADHAFTIESADLQCRAGNATVGFYLLDVDSFKRGISITGMDPLTVTSTTQKAIPTGNNTLTVGQRLKFSVISSSAGQHLVYRVVLRKTS